MKKRFVLEVIRFFALRWRQECGYRDILKVAVPLILSTGSWSIQHFVDRVFLARYSAQAIAAAVPAGLLNFTTMCIFLGTAGYAGTFIAQYCGAGQKRRVGSLVWQGIYVAAIGWVAHLLLIPVAEGIFTFFGHEAAVLRHEVEYFRILCAGAGPAIAASALSGFFSGRGKTWPVMWVNTAATAVNIFLDYVLIFGKLGFPEWGVSGAAVATVVSGIFSFLVYLGLFLSAENRRVYRAARDWRVDPAVFRKLLRYGFPDGMQLFLDVAGFSLFLLVLGTLGSQALAATNVTLAVNTLAFMPMLGLGIAVSVLVGQNQGADRPELSERTVYSALQLAAAYMVPVAAFYVFFPGVFLRPFLGDSGIVADPEIPRMAGVLLRYVAAYTLFDTLTIVFGSGLKGSGDTRFVMGMVAAASLLCLVVPVCVMLLVLKKGIHGAWAFTVLYGAAMGMGFCGRFLAGRWKEIRMVEPVAFDVRETIVQGPSRQELP